MLVSIKAARINAGLSQIKLAELLGVSSSTMSRWELGVIKIPEEKLNELCRLCHIDKEMIKEYAERK